MRAVVARPTNGRGLVIENVGNPSAPLPTEVLVRCEVISLNQGEVRHALESASEGARPGWDFAGVVEHAADDGTGPALGQRVVGFVEEGAWCERLVAPATSLAVLPPGISPPVAASLPVAGLTALYTLAEGGLLAGKRILVNGASGGVGHLALQLGRASGAKMIAAVRRPEQVTLAYADGAHDTVVTEDLSEAASLGPYDLILESTGGDSLGQALRMLASGGACVSYGNSSRRPTTFDAFDFFIPHGLTRLVGFYLLPVLRREPASTGLGRLLTAVASGDLKPRIEVQASWREITSIVRRFVNREITGKVVLHVD
jgi:NADPH:quinone reductase